MRPKERSIWRRWEFLQSFFLLTRLLSHLFGEKEKEAKGNSSLPEGVDLRLLIHDVILFLSVALVFDTTEHCVSTRPIEDLDGAGVGEYKI